MKVREIAYPSDNFSHYIFYTINLLVKIRVQLQFGKLLISHRTELRKSAVGQFPQFRFLRRKLAAHLTQTVNQPSAAAGIVNAHQVHLHYGLIPGIRPQRRSRARRSPPHPD